jgi:hypothetical protein
VTPGAGSLRGAGKNYKQFVFIDVSSMLCCCGKPVSCLATQLPFICPTTGLAKATGEALSASGWAVLGIETPRDPLIGSSIPFFLLVGEFEVCEFTKRGSATDQPVAAI